MAKKVTTISPKARKLIRMLRGKLGRAIWTLNESDLVDSLRDKYRGEQPWTKSDISKLSREVGRVQRIASDVGVKLQKVLKDRRLSIQRQSRQRIESAITAIQVGTAALGKVSPGKIGQVIEVTFGQDVDEDPGYLVPALFFGFCKDETTGALMEEGCYTYGMKTLRLAVVSLYYTLQAKDGRNFVLNEVDSQAWRDAIEESGKPPGALYSQFQSIANDEATTVYVYDFDKELVGVIPPVAWLAGEDQMSMMTRSALAQSKKARAAWDYRWANATPSDIRQFRESLTPSQKKKVTQFLKDHPGRAFSIHEIAALTGIDIEPLEEMPAWAPFVIGERLKTGRRAGMRRQYRSEEFGPEMRDISAFEGVVYDRGRPVLVGASGPGRMERLTYVESGPSVADVARQYTENPSDGYDSAGDAFRDIGLMQAIWSMDL